LIVYARPILPVEISTEARKFHSAFESFHLSLRIRHPTLNPADISRELWMEPDDYCFKAGE
jgi:hypothetical protein